MAEFSPAFGAGQGIGQLIAALIARRGQQQFRQQPIGQVLGFPGVAPSVPTPGPIQGPPNIGPTVPIASPVTGRGGVMTAPTPPLAFPTAPAALQPLASRPVGDIMRLSRALGEPTTRDLLGASGISRTPGSMLEFDEKTGEFSIRSGAKEVPAQTANILLRQKDIANKKSIGDWRAAVEKRLERGQLTREEALALRADSDLLGFMLDPEFDLLGDTIKSQLESQALAAINRLQQRGVKVLTGSRAKKSEAAPPTPTAPSRPAATGTGGLEARWNAIKAANPALTDIQVDAQLAIEEASK